MHKSKKDRKKYIRVGVIILAALLFVTSVLMLISGWEKRQGEYTGTKSQGEDVFVYNGKEYTVNEDIETFLVLGLDAYDHTEGTGGKRADFVMLFVIDNASRSYTALQIDRDTVVEMKKLDITGNKVVGTVKGQLALAHTYGNGKERSCRNVADAVSNLLLGVSVDHYVSVTMDAVPVYNDYIGGVTLEVMDDFTGIDDSLVKGKTVTLMGDSVLNYVGARQGLEEPTNTRRMERQRQYLKALYEKTRTLDNSLSVNAVSKVAEYLVSDCSVNKLQGIFEKVSAYTLNDLVTLQGESAVKDGYIEVYPDADGLKATVAELFYIPKE